MAGTQRPDFEDFVSARGLALQRFDCLLTGDWALAEDLVQTALARAYPRWSRIDSDDPEACVRKAMANVWSSWWRRRWRDEVPTLSVPDFAATANVLSGRSPVTTARMSSSRRSGSRVLKSA